MFCLDLGVVFVVRLVVVVVVEVVEVVVVLDVVRTLLDDDSLKTLVPRLKT